MVVPQLSDVIKEPGSLHFPIHFPKHVDHFLSALLPLGHKVAANFKLKGNDSTRELLSADFPFN